MQLHKFLKQFYRMLILIPQAAVTRTPTGQAIALIVNAKGAIEPRPITTVGVKGQTGL
jgi:hypothetical protein